MRSKKHKFGLCGLLLIAILILFLPSVFAVTVRLISNTDYCFNCETIYEICKDSEKDSTATFDIQYYKPIGSKSTSVFSKDVYAITDKVITEQQPVYDTRIITTQITDNKTGNLTTSSYSESYIKSYQPIEITETTYEKTPIIDFNKQLTDLKDGDCSKLSVKGTLKPGEAIDNVLIIDGISYSRWSWWNSSFLYYRPIGLNSAANLSLTNFPGYVEIDTAALISAGKMQNDCDDIRILDPSKNQVAHEVENCNSTKTIVWFLMPTFNMSVVNNFSIYYGASTAGNVENNHGIWEVAGYGGVWHLANTSDSLGPNTLSQHVNASYLENVVCKFGKCLRLNSSQANIGRENPIGLASGADNSTISLWGYIDKDDGGATHLFGYGVDTTRNARILDCHEDGSLFGLYLSTNGDSTGTARTSNFNFTTTTRYFAGIFFNTTWGRMYVGGDIFNQAKFAGAFNTATTRLRIGHIGNISAANWAQTVGSTAYVDELRYANVSRTDAWLLAEYSTISVLGAEISNELLFFDSQTPPDLTSFNFINKRVNITFNYTGLNGTAAILYHKSNNSVSDYWYFINGTSYTNNTPQTCANTSIQVLCQLDDNQILPGTYNIDFDNDRYNQHQVLGTLAHTNEWWKVGLFNVSAYRYGWFEIMANSSTAFNVPVIYCNSSYTTGNPLINPNCVQFATFTANSAYNHSHGPYSSHHAFVFAVNETSGNINGVKVTPLSYFLVRGDTGGLVIYGTANNSLIANNQRSDNNGAAWSGNVGVTTDAHLHQLKTPVSFIYKACGYKKSDNTEICSDLTTDIIELDYIPPTTPFIYSVPEIITRYTILAVNWTESIDPNNFPLSYNLSLFDENGTYADYNRFGNATQQNLNVTFTPGNYTFGVYSIDSIGYKSGFSYTNQFRVCVINYTCISFGACQPYNLSLCLDVEDLGCGYAFSGNLTDYNVGCYYSPPIITTDLTTIDLSKQTNVILFGLFLFFWIGLAVLTMTFRNFLYGSMMFIVGILLGFWCFSISWILTAMFLMFSTLLFMKSARF